MIQQELAQNIYQAALRSGFDNCGIIPLDEMDGFEERLKERVEKVPSSGGFYQGVAELAKIQERFPWAKSVIVCTFDYSRYRYPKSLQGKFAKAFFLDPEADSTQGYHTESFEQWFAGQGIRCEGGRQYGAFSVGPLRYAAMKSGLGIMRKNNFFYTEKGSYVHLIGYVMDQACTLVHHPEINPCADSCTLCQKACKTKALSAPYTFDPMKCVSFLTTFGKGNIPDSLQEEMCEEWLCGCDNCQDACPYNIRHNWDEGEAFSDVEEIAPAITPEGILTLPDKYLIEHVITKTSGHLQPEDVTVLCGSAARALRFRDKNKNYE